MEILPEELVGIIVSFLPDITLYHSCRLSSTFYREYWDRLQRQRGDLVLWMKSMQLTFIPPSVMTDLLSLTQHQPHRYIKPHATLAMTNLTEDEQALIELLIVTTLPTSKSPQKEELLASLLPDLHRCYRRSRIDRTYIETAIQGHPDFLDRIVVPVVRDDPTILNQVTDSASQTYIRKVLGWA